MLVVVIVVVVGSVLVTVSFVWRGSERGFSFFFFGLFREWVG